MHLALIGSHADYMRRFRGGFIREVADRGCRVTCFVPDPATTDWSEVPADVQDISLQRSGLNPLADLRTVARLRKALATAKPDIVVAYSAKPIAYGLRAAYDVGVPSRVALFTGLGSFIRPSTLSSRVAAIPAKRILAPAVRKATLVLCQNPDDLAFLRHIGWARQDASALAPATGVDLQWFSLQDPLATPSALFAGRLVKEKGVHDFVRAASIVRRQIPNAVFSIAGMAEPAFRGISGRSLRQWEQSGDLNMLGWQTDLRPVLARHAVFVLPSTYGEGVPRSGQEAMSSGRPVVTTDWPGCRELIDDGVQGYLVRPNDPQAIARRLLEMFHDPKRLVDMQRAARQRAEDRFDLTETSSQLASLVLGDTSGVNL